MSFIRIPKGKKVEFTYGGATPIPGTENIDLILEEDLTLSMSSSFSPVKDSNSSSFLSILSKEIGKFLGEDIGALSSGQLKQFGFQTWTGTEPLSTTLTISLYMKDDAYKDVVVPAMSLAKICLPEEGSKIGELLGPGPSLSEALKDDINLDQMVGLSDSDYSIVGKPIYCYIGNFVLKNTVITSAQPTFSKTTDQYGYPISARIEVSVITLFVATKQMLDGLIGGI
jgi:hypothetical protein